MAAAKIEASSVLRWSSEDGSVSSDRRIMSPRMGQRERTARSIGRCRDHHRAVRLGPTQGPIRRATRFEFELTKSGSERDRVVNSETPVNQRLREFWREIPGCGRDLEGSSRTPVGLSRNGESPRATRSDANRCVKGGNAKTPGRRFLDAGR